MDQGTFNMEEKIKKEITLNDLLDAIKENTRENKMVQNFLYKILEEAKEQTKLLKEIKQIEVMKRWVILLRPKQEYPFLLQ